MVSVVIPVLNRKTMVLEAIESVLSQDLSDLECIVVDDGSDDGTPDAVTSVPDPRVRCVRKARSGAAASRNAGMREARGRFLAFLDSDDIWLPGKLSRQVRDLEKDPGLSFSYGRYRPERAGTPLRSRPAAGPSGMIFRSLVRRIFVQTSTVVMPASAAGKTGFYDETLEYSDEYDYFLRAARLGPASFVPEDLVRYRIHDGNLSLDHERRVRENLKVYTRLAEDPSLGRADSRAASARAARYEFLMGALLRGRGDEQAAKSHFRKALGWRPVYPRAWAAMAGLGASKLDSPGD